MPCLSKVDIITAGVPCQDVSVAGKRAGLAGERTGLFYEFARILQEVRPPWFVFENVPGLLSSNHGRDFAEVLRVLMVECGYGVCWRLLDSQFFGVAQRRRRLFIVGCLGRPCPAEVLFEPQSRKRHSAKGAKAGTGVAYALAAGAGGSKFGSGRQGQDIFIVCSSIYGLGDGGPDDSAAQQGHIVIQDVRGGTRDQTDKGQGIGISEGGPCYTLSKTEQHAVGYECSPPDPDRVRDFAGLPEGLDSARYRALGNAVTVQVAEWIARRIIAINRRRGDAPRRPYRRSEKG